ncbi:squalene/phytoene synthase family protein [Pantanalinema rosaneae CENA516]|uniref:squalene/phytoene synthase family protein n=1 Tax=Pantanalinema rosaneae TaxID=1620701 RepID=UPI003D6FA555
MANQFGSSLYAAVADDTLKDEDNAAWVTELESDVQNEWVQRIRWIRWIDRLAEQDLLNPGSHQFYTFFMEWKGVVETGQVAAGSIYTEFLLPLYDRWWQSTGVIDYPAIRAWQRYLSAIARYHIPNLVIPTLDQYEMMLKALAGSFFQLFPYLPRQYRQAAYSLGAIDQFYNNLRDLSEDAVQGICYLPEELLQEYSVRREEILQFTAYQNPNYHRMMQFWLENYLPRLHHQAQEILAAEDLHPSWQILRHWSLHRYHRIIEVFRACNFNYAEFPRMYWAMVQHELPLLLAEVRQSEPICQSLPCHWQSGNRGPGHSSRLVKPLRSNKRLVQQPLSA